MKYVYISLLALLSLSACRSERLDEQSILNKTAPASELDRWCQEHITTPYQAEVIYRWEPHRSHQSSYTYPPKESQVRPALECLEATVLRLYRDKNLFASQGFLPEAPLLRIYLYGGGQIDGRGVDLPFDRSKPAIELHLYHIDRFDPSKEVEVYRLIRSAQHQIGRHLLDLRPADLAKFIAFSQKNYTDGDTSPFSDALRSYLSRPDQLREGLGPNRYAWSRGFYSIYGMLGAEVDLAETYSVTLTETPNSLSAMETDAARPDEAEGDPVAQARYAQEAREAHAALVAKRAFLNDYFTTTWRFPLYRLQLGSLTLMNQYLSAHATPKP